MKPFSSFHEVAGVKAPVHTDTRGNDVVHIWSSRSRQQLAFSLSHGGGTRVSREGEDWVPSTHTLPLQITPRPGFADGILTTVSELLAVFYPEAAVVG